jgi:methylenetetrahydrofolate dehydrogenase (NADP+)/methenyltetrahydrofolate cyclohydrolase
MLKTASSVEFRAQVCELKPMLILDGKQVSRDRREKLKSRVAAFTQKAGRAPHLVVVLIGENPASQVYVRNKIKACENVGMKSTKYEYPTMQPRELDELIAKLNADTLVDGVLVQLPLPKPLHEDQVNEHLSASKDADGLTYPSMGYLFGGKPWVASCTPAGVISILQYYKIPIEGKHAVVVGRSQIVGKPMAQLLLAQNATVTICHSKTQNLSEITKLGDIVVVAAGKARMLGKNDFKKGAVIVDVGIHGTGTGGDIVGDVRFEELDGWAAAATPVPGGVGPMTITTLLENTVTLAEKRVLKI